MNKNVFLFISLSLMHIANSQLKFGGKTWKSYFKWAFRDSKTITKGIMSMIESEIPTLLKDHRDMFYLVVSKKGWLYEAYENHGVLRANRARRSSFSMAIGRILWHTTSEWAHMLTGGSIASDASMRNANTHGHPRTSDATWETAGRLQPPF